MKRKAGIRIILSTILGFELIFSSNCKKEEDNNILSDADGNVYQTITIGTQIWMAENLKTTKYNDNTDIPFVESNTDWRVLTSPGYCWAGSNDLINAVYGALYNWHAVSTGKLCPVGWHVPVDSEWTILTDYLGGDSVAGGKMKETGTEHWESPNEGATNESGFTALPGGYRNNYGAVALVGEIAWWWSATDFETIYGFTRYINLGSNSINSINHLKEYGFNIRCISD
jgi:uncharacterized protein (TIGR02145 family)